MAAELLARKTERSPTHYEGGFSPKSTRFSIYIDYLSQMMPEEKRSLYVEGAQLAYLMTKAFKPELDDISPQTFQFFLTQVTQAARDTASRHINSWGENEGQKRFNIDEIIGKHDGLNFLRPAFSKIYDGESVYNLFSGFESPYIKSGARTAIELTDLEISTTTEKSQPEIVAPPVEMFQGIDWHLLSA